jgi:hypothetical protein
VASQSSGAPGAAFVSVTVHIDKPDGSVPVHNPIPANGTYSPATATVTAWVIDGQGRRVNGTVQVGSQGGQPVWGATFGPAAPGQGAVHAKAQVGTDSDEDSVNVTIQ